MAFEDGIKSNELNLVEIGKCIVKKCVGVPLSIRTIGRSLNYNHSIEYWTSFMNDELSKMPQLENDILPTLKLSYDHLPSHLKQCFAYCALFPKDYVIEKELLIDLWMAQGFLQSSNMNRCLEDIGNEHIMNLVSRSFLQDVEYDEGENKTTCKMNDLMHDLATLVANSECILVKLDASNIDEKARHISFDSRLLSSWDIQSFPTTMLKVKHARTFLLVGDLYAISDLNKSNCKKILSSFGCLRALEFSHSSIREVPNSIGKLKHLRYVDLSYNQFLEKLPDSITLLRNLEVLKVIGYRLKKLPRHINKMVSLRCLMNHDCWFLVGMPSGLGQLTSIRTLSWFGLGKVHGGNADLSELNKLNNLRGKLIIKSLEKATSIEATLANLKAKQHLEWLVLLWNPHKFRGVEGVNDDDAVLDGLQPHQNLKQLQIIWFRGLTIPNWVSSLKNVITIVLSRCVRCIHLPALDQLPSLERLHLLGLYDLEYMSETGRSVSSSFFPSLKELFINGCDNLKGWWKIDGNKNKTNARAAFISLSFQIKNPILSNLIFIPLYPSLEELELNDTSLKPLQKTMTSMTSSVAPSTASTFSAPLSKLKSLTLINCYKFDLLTNEHDKQWEGLASLRCIKLSRLPDLVSLPMGLQYLTTLQQLHISGCSQFSKRWRNNMDLEWSKIAHTPNIEIDDEWIHKDGSYQLNSEGCSSSLLVSTRA